jgi:hypothetical protein
MALYTYSNSTQTIWTSFDYGEVEADSLDEAREKAIAKLKYDIRKCNDVFDNCDITNGLTIDMDYSQTEVELKK